MIHACHSSKLQHYRTVCQFWMTLFWLPFSRMAKNGLNSVKYRESQHRYRDMLKLVHFGKLILLTSANISVTNFSLYLLLRTRCIKQQKSILIQPSITIIYKLQIAIRVLNSEPFCNWFNPKAF